MANEAEKVTHRVLVIDDNAAIHEDFRKILVAVANSSEVSAAEAALFGAQQPAIDRPTFHMDSAMQGRDGVERARQALAEGRPYSVAFVDMRMPPGWDGLETIEHLWQVDPEVQVVVCSAYSDYDWLELLTRLMVHVHLLRLGHDDDLAARGGSPHTVFLEGPHSLSRRASGRVPQADHRCRGGHRESRDRPRPR